MPAAAMVMPAIQTSDVCGSGRPGMPRMPVPTMLTPMQHEMTA